MIPVFTVVIPSRYASTRLPGKPLQMIAGKPMVQHVWEQACKSSAQRVVVATDDMRIVEACKAFGAEVLLTRADHESGTDRLAEVATQLGLASDAIVVNVQGDEPMIPPQVIDQVALNLAAHGEASMATLAEPIDDVETLFNPNVVKVVSDINGLALTPIERASCMTSSAGGLAGSKTPSASSNCGRCGMVCVFTWPMCLKLRLPG